MRDFFNSLDTTKCGTVGFEEIEETLISFGLLKTKEEVKRIVIELFPHINGEYDFETFM